MVAFPAPMDKPRIAVVGAPYDVDSGDVEFLPTSTRHLVATPGVM